MEQLEVDMLGVYAYADSAHARERELWRGFLSYALPVVMSTSSDLIDQCLAESIVYHFDELTARNSVGLGKRSEAMRCISALLAKEIGVPQEFALAAFFEGELPTKLYKVKSRLQKRSLKAKKEDAVISTWLSHLAKIQSENRFLNQVEKWKTWLYPIESKSKVS